MRLALTLQRTDCPITPVKRADFLYFPKEVQRNLHFFRYIFQTRMAGGRDDLRFSLCLKSGQAKNIWLF